MQCFYVACREYPATIGTLTGGFLLTAFGSPLGTLMTAKDSHAELFPSLQRGFYLKGLRGRYFTDLRLARHPSRSLKIEIAPELLAVDDALEEGEGPYLPKLLCAAVEKRDGKIRLIPELDSEGNDSPENNSPGNNPETAPTKVLVAIRAGLGTADYLDYKVGESEILLHTEDEDPCLLAIMSPGETIVALRSDKRWWNRLGFKHRKPVVAIQISFDGEKLSVTRA